MQNTKVQRKLLKEQIIREYQIKRQPKQPFNDIFRSLKKNMALTIFVGLFAAIGLVYLSGWKTLVVLILSGLVWLTMISTGLTVMHKNK
ncbi:MAG: hypothetical protein ABIE94_04120 [archaeon]